MGNAQKKGQEKVTTEISEVRGTAQGIDFFNHPPQANHEQVGGSHYLGLDPQPFEVGRKWGFNHAEGEILYHLIRHKLKGGKRDILKCIHWLSLIAEAD